MHSTSWSRVETYFRHAFADTTVLLSAGVDGLSQKGKGSGSHRNVLNFSDEIDASGEHNFGTFNLGYFTFVLKVNYHESLSAPRKARGP